MADTSGRVLGESGVELRGWAIWPYHLQSSNPDTQIDNSDINHALFKQAVLALVHKEPNLRCDVRVKADGNLWFTQATDFSEVFEYLDYSSRAP